jgi:hypothetical protein
VTDTYTKAAFYSVVDEPNEVDQWYVSLYSVDPFYGGPQEGGWWGEDQNLVCWKVYPSKEEAEKAKARVELVAKTFNKIESTKWSVQCERELDIAEAKGMESNDLFGETDGPTTYIVIVEKEIGSNAYRSSRSYE